jgi:hypothetical protein
MMGAPRASAEAVALASGAEPVCRKCVCSEIHAAMFACVRGVCAVCVWSWKRQNRVIGSTEFVRYIIRGVSGALYCVLSKHEVGFVSRVHMLY